MGVRIKVTYEGDKHCRLVHEPSGSVFETDAPVDNQGRGERFSPTDLMGASLGSCVLTTMAIVGDRLGVKLLGATAEVVKEMKSDPRRVGQLLVKVQMPKGIPADLRPRLEQAALHCPVHQSLHPEIEAPVELIYPD